MSLEHDLARVPRNPVTFEAWLKTATQEDADLVLAYLRDPHVMAKPLMATLRKHGIPISKETVEAYREPSP